MTRHVEPPTWLEGLVCYLSRQFHDGDLAAIASGLPVVAYAALLAHHMDRPNMRLLIGLSLQNFWHRPPPGRLYDAVDFRGSHGAEAYTRHYENLEGLHRTADVFVGGALQVDRYGNSNLIGLRHDDPEATGLRFRGPGALGTTTMCAHVQRWHLYLNRHEPGTFVESCDYVSSVGYGAGGPEGRAATGTPGHGPSFVLSPLGVLDFPAPEHRMRLLHTSSGVAVEEVAAATGFDLDTGDATPLPAPTERELRLLRAIDRHAMLRTAQTRA